MFHRTKRNKTKTGKERLDLSRILPVFHTGGQINGVVRLNTLKKLNITHMDIYATGLEFVKFHLNNKKKISDNNLCLAKKKTLLEDDSERFLEADQYEYKFSFTIPEDGLPSCPLLLEHSDSVAYISYHLFTSLTLNAIGRKSKTHNNYRESTQGFLVEPHPSIYKLLKQPSTNLNNYNFKYEGKYF